MIKTRIEALRRWADLTVEDLAQRIGDPAAAEEIRAVEAGNLEPRRELEQAVSATVTAHRQSQGKHLHGPQKPDPKPIPRFITDPATGEKFPTVAGGANELTQKKPIAFYLFGGRSYP